MTSKNRIFSLFSLMIFSVTGIICLYSLINFPLETVNFAFFGLLAITFLLSSFIFNLPRTQLRLSVADVLIFFTILKFGVEIAVLLAALEMLYSSFSLRRKGNIVTSKTIAYNIATAVIATFLAGITARFFFHYNLQLTNYPDVSTMTAILAVIAIIYFLVNSVMASIFVSQKSEKDFWQVWNKNCFNTVVIFAISATVAGFMIQAVENVNTILLIVTATISTTAYLTYQRYIEDVTETHAKAEQAERERAEQAENHIVELQHYVSELEKTSEALTESKDRFRYAAYHDALTNLANRNKFNDRLKFLLEKTKHQPELKFAVMFLDLNRFKTINDSLGYAIGNRLILHVAKRIENAIRESDLAARFSGDEFAIILNNVAGVEEVTQVAETLNQKISKPYTLNGRQVFTSASIGIALSNARYEEAENILRDADIAMYHAKELEKSYTVFDQNMHARAVTLMQIETDLRYAIERNELLVFYQPIINLDTIELIGFEALMRWQHPTRGLVPPYEFIPVSELTGLIVPLTLWILRASCEQIVNWQSSSPSNKNLMISVNLSGKHFAHADLVEQIQKILRETKLEPSCLKLEITETAIMENAETAINMLKQLRDIGIQLSIDDFGTGYSSLSYLHRFPINTLKVDRSFVSTMEDGSENGEIVRTIIALAKTLKLSVIAEGIESIHQLHQLRILGCEYGQGYLFSRPVPANEIERILADKTRWRDVLPHINFGVFGQSHDFPTLEIDDINLDQTLEH